MEILQSLNIIDGLLRQFANKGKIMILYYTEIEDMDYSWYSSHLELLQDYLTGENL